MLPAQWLSQASSAFRAKGRIQPGADADIVIFNPETIAARAQYGNPYQPSMGISHVLVAGRLVVEDAAQVEGRYPGRHLLAPLPND